MPSQREKCLKDERWIWSRYWQYDRVASCMDGAGASNYDPAIANGWRGFFQSLPPAMSVLDLCTGNGAIALLAAEVSQQEGKGLTVVGVDQADIDPKAYVTQHSEDLDQIQFKAAVLAEELPFPDRSFGAIVSQYGIEYTDIPRSIAEVGRVLSATGRLRFAVHAADGAVTAGARQSVQDAAFLLDTIGLPGAAERCLKAVVTAERDPAAPQVAKSAAEQSLSQFQAALTEAARYLEFSRDRVMIQCAGSVLADTYNKRSYFHLDQLLTKVGEVRTEILAHQGRSNALIRAALGREQLEAITEELHRADVPKVHWSTVENEGRLLGYLVEGSRAT